MIKKIFLSNFKCFEELDSELGNLTLLSGINSMGKSTVMQALLLLRNSYENGFFFKPSEGNKKCIVSYIGKQLKNHTYH